MATMIAIQPLAPRPGPMAIPVTRPRSHEGMHNKPTTKSTLKAIANITNSRPRKERPCDGCRRRKSKCVLQESRRCVLCEFHKQDCTFVEAAQPRKRKLDDSAKKDQPAVKSPKLSHDQSRAADVLPQTQAAPPSTAALVVREDSVIQFKDITTPLSNTLSLQRDRHCRLIGRTSALDASLIGLSDFGERNETILDFGAVRKVANHDFFMTHADAEFPTFEDERQSLLAVEQTVAPHGPALIDIYFRNVHPSFPVIQKQVFLDRHRHGDRQFNASLLAGMYLLALRWWSQDPVLAQQVPPSSQRLEEIATRSLNIAMQRPKLSALQAGLLLLQRHNSNAWGLTVQLVALAQDLGLHLDCSEWSIPPWERRLRKRLAWALYIQDKWTALVQGRPSHVQDADWAVQPLISTDFDERVTAEGQDLSPEAEDPEAEKSHVIFTQMIELTGIMAQVINVFYTQKAISEFERAGAHAIQLILGKAKPVQLQLKEWYTRLPETAKMDSYTSGTLSSNGYLHLAYFATEISIHRRIVQTLDPKTADPYMLYICRSAAKTRLISAMDFVNRLKPEHLESFWYFASITNFSLISTFGSLLLATAPAREEAQFYESRLREYRWALSVSSKRAEWLEQAVHMLDSTTGLLQNVQAKPSTAGQARQPQAPQQTQPQPVQMQIPQPQEQPQELMGDFDFYDDSDDMDYGDYPQLPSY